MRRRDALCLPLAVMGGIMPMTRARAASSGVTVFAAASLSEALRAVSAAWHARGHAALVLSLAASSTLARQIAAGADADVFASADEQWMDWLAQRGLIAPGTRRDLLGNSLVLVVPKGRARTLDINGGLDLDALLGPDGRLAVADTGSVPAGIYARQALSHLGLWDRVAHRLAPAENVRQALLLVERGEAPAGIVYATDAAVAPGVAIAGTFPAGSHDPITYPFAAVHGHDTPEARAYLDFLAGPEAGAAFRRFGFRLLQG